MKFLRQQPDRFDTRVVTKFAILPITASTDSGEVETRWLEWVKVEQVYSPVDHGNRWVTKNFL